MLKMKIIVFILFIGIVICVTPPKVALQFSSNFSLSVNGIFNFEGYSYFDYINAGGHTSFTDPFGLPWTGVANTTKNNQSSLYYWQGNGACAHEGPFNKTELDELFRWEIPANATFLGYQSLYGYNCSNWSFTRYGAVVNGCVDDWSGGVVSMKFIYPNTLFNYFTIDNWNIYVGPMDETMFQVPQKCQKQTIDSPSPDWKMLWMKIFSAQFKHKM